MGKNNWDGKFNGTYDTSRYADRTLRDDLLDAMEGKYIKGDDSYLSRQTDDRLDIWFKGDGKGNYDHYYLNGNNPEDHGKAPDGRHND